MADIRLVGVNLDSLVLIFVKGSVFGETVEDSQKQGLGDPFSFAKDPLENLDSREETEIDPRKDTMKGA
ncbi:hypothetical protein NDU88_009373 [Pleurodeles waltl]|uniref:Uncharacterized protein n=1 Tax=Pleurodeles waltl TaxID=8319 RepID=A0AAV7PZ89_PLEWA|nr:hypothetical protein NDU88_009373 [Pleurodeles waltl]